MWILLIAWLVYQPGGNPKPEFLPIEGFQSEAACEKAAGALIAKHLMYDWACLDKQDHQDPKESKDSKPKPKKKQ